MTTTNPTTTRLLRLALAAMAGCVALACSWSLGVSSASAAPLLVDRFVGGPTGGGLGEFSQGRDVAVHEASGRVYVVESTGDRVQRLGLDGSVQRVWGKDVDAAAAGTGFEICTAVCKGGEAGTAKGEFKRPSGIAVDQSSGDVYVWDRGSGSSGANSQVRIQRFDADGNFILMFGKGVNQTTGGDVCTEASGHVCQAGSPGSGAGQLGGNVQQPRLEVAPSGDLFAADPANRRVVQYTSAGVFVRAMGWGVRTGANEFQTCTTATGCQGGLTTAGTQDGRFGSNQPQHLAIDSTGVVYLSDSNLSNRVQRLDPAAASDAAIPLAAVGVGPLVNGTTLGLKVARDPDGGGPIEDRLLVLRDPAVSTDETIVQELGSLTTSPALVETHGGGLGFGSLLGLGANATTNAIYLSLHEQGLACGTPVCSGYFALNIDGTDPSVTVSGVGGSAATSTTIEVVGIVDPGNGLARYRFEYSPDGVNYQSLPYATVIGSGPVEVSAQLTGLDPNTLYRVRLHAEKVLGPNTVISDTSIEAIAITASEAPAITPMGPADRTDTTATLRGLLDPRGSSTTYRFEYGPAGGSFDHHAPVPDAPAGAGNGASLIAQPIGGLQPDTSYHYRLVAANTAGTTTGQTVTFTTQPTTPAPGPLADREHELVSPAYKIGGVGLGEWGSGQQNALSMGFAATDGEHFAAVGTRGSMLLDGAQAYANDWAFADRVDGVRGWVSRSPFTHPATSGQLAKFLYIHAATDDLSRLAWWTNNSTIGIFPETLGWPGSANPSFMSSWGGRWEVYGPNVEDPVGEGQFPTSFPTGPTPVCDIAFAGDGSRAVCSTKLNSGISLLRGLGGAEDPTGVGYPDLVGGRSVYVADSSGELANDFAGTGPRRLVNVCSAGTEIPAVEGSGDLGVQGCVDQPGRDDLVSSRGAATVDVDVNSSGGIRGTPENVVSEDGSRVFFMSPDPIAGGVPNGTSSFCTGSGASTVCPTQLFVRQDNGDGTHTTRWISKAEDGLFGSQDASLTGTVRFERATADGDKVLFRTNSPLTADDRNATGTAPVTTGDASNESWDLYLYDFPDDPEADPGDGTLTRISGGPDGTADCNVQPGGSSSAVAAVRHASVDASRIVLTCAAPLDGVAFASNGTITQPAGSATTADAINLYSYDAVRPAGDRYRFIARVPRSTDPDVANCAGAGPGPTAPLNGNAFGTLLANCVRGTSDGSFITFWTAGRLTVDDPDATTADIYAYDTDTDTLTRISAPQGGVGGSYACGTNTAQQCYADNGYDHDGTGRSPKPALGVATDPLVAGDRMAFFQSKSRLVATDIDDQMDVYQWRNGKLSLLSTGDSDTHGAFYKGNDRTGRNVYMVTQDQLSWQDFDSVFDAYTARTDGGIPEPVTPVCDLIAADGCQGSGSGSGVATAVAPVSGRPAGGDAVPGVRPVLRVAGVGRRARRLAARSGVLMVRARSNVAGVVRIVARARVGRKVRRVGRGSHRFTQPGAARVRIRLSRVARKQLRSGRRLNVRLHVRSAGARPKSVKVALRRAGR